MKRDDVSRYPYPLKLAMDAANEKRQSFYGSEKDLSQSRKRSNASQRRKFAAIRIMKSLGL